jgi:hypothetical protein
LLKQSAFVPDNLSMAIPVGAKPITPKTTVSTPSTDLSAALKQPMATKADLANVLKTLQPGVLADALTAKPPQATGSSEFLQALLDTLKADKANPKSQVAADRLDKLNALAKSLAPATTTPPATKDAVGTEVKQTKTAEQKAVDTARTADDQKQIAARQSKSSGLGFETSEAPKADATNATAPAAPVSDPAKVDQLEGEIKGQIDQIDTMLRAQIPQSQHELTSDAMNGSKPMPPAAKPFVAQMNAALGQIQQKIATLSEDDKTDLYQRLGVNYQASQGGPKQTTLTLPGQNNASMGNNLDPAQSPAARAGQSGLNAPQVLNGAAPTGTTTTQTDPQTLPPVDQLKDIFVLRLRASGIQFTSNHGQPSPLQPIDWADPKGNLAGAPRDGAGAAAQLPPLQPMPGGLEKMVDGFGPVMSPDQMTQLLAAAKKQNLSADQIADQLVSQKGPFAQLAPRMGASLNTLMSALDQKDKNFNARANGLVALMSAQAASTPGIATQGNLMSADEMTQLLKTRSPTDVAKELISGKSPLQGRLTGEALSVLQGALDPKIPKTKAQAQEYVQLSDGLKKLEQQVPPGVGSVMMNAPQGVPNGPMWWTAAQATLGMGFMPSGNIGLDLANAVAQAPAYSPAEQQLLQQIQDPQQRAMQMLQMFMQKQALLTTMLSNLANMRHEMLKTVANNLRG